ncbi:MAG TPA: hypothetical protein VFT99_23595, partial [Roseiflexaceae bacterium]|nr:hypothetical protein [Roseiflexaceae bacterium]
VFDTPLMPAMDLLVNDLRATLYRVDVFGTSDWPDPDGSLGPASLEPERLAALYNGKIARRGWAMMRYLNSHGIKPYLTCSGIVPPWMCAADANTLVDFDNFATMLVSLVDWAKNHEQLDFELFGPMNETNLGRPEGPYVEPHAYARILEILHRKLAERGLDDIRFVVAEESGVSTRYMQEILDCDAIERVAAWGMHTYGNPTPETYAAVRNLAGGIPVWMTEYGDLEQTGEREWLVAWLMTGRLFDLLEGGFRAAMVWDAYDNYHDHDEHWTIYGLIRTGLRAYTPKKRYFASKQVFRYVPPGFRRIAASASSADLRVLAFANEDSSKITVVGMNDGDRTAYLNVDLKAVPAMILDERFACYRTSATESCARVADIPARGGNWPVRGIDAEIPPHTIFTLTNVD